MFNINLTEKKKARGKRAKIVIKGKMPKLNIFRDEEKLAFEGERDRGRLREGSKRRRFGKKRKRGRKKKLGVMKRFSPYY